MTYLNQNVAGKGLKFGTVSSIYTARQSVSVGDIAMVTEGGTADNSDVKGGINGNDDGTLANTVAVGVNAANGAVLGWFVIATEAAGVGQTFRGISEGYNVQAKVTTVTATLPVRTKLHATTGNLLHETAPNISSPICGRLLLALTATRAAVLTPVHFRGCPGGFAIGAGA